MRRLLMAGACGLSLVISGSTTAVVAAPVSGGSTAKATSKAPAAGFVSKLGRFSVSASGTPREEKERFETPAGPATIRLYHFRTAGGSQTASWAEYPAAINRHSTSIQILDGGRDGLVRSVNGTLLNEREIAYYKHPGRELRVDIGGRFQMLARIFVVRNRIYQVMFLAAKDQFPEEEARAFVQSFALLK